MSELINELFYKLPPSDGLRKTFFYQGFLSQTLTTDRTAGEGRGPSFYSTLPLPPAHEHWYIYLQLCMWNDYHVFLIATLVFTRLLLHEIYHLIELPFELLIIYYYMRLLGMFDEKQKCVTYLFSCMGTFRLIGSLS